MHGSRVLRYGKTFLAALPFLFMLLAAHPACSAQTEPPVPSLLPALGEARGTDAVLAALAGIPYRQDGGIDEKGDFILLADPAQRFDSPGLNCSGLVIEALRFLLGKNISVHDATRDRLNDSGPDSPLGHDWDFGWDLTLNLSEGLPRALLLPGNRKADPAALDGMAARGFDLHAKETWAEMPERIRPGYLYLVSFNRENAAKGYTLLHYHVGLLHRDARGDIILTQTTGQSAKSYQRNLSRKQGLDLFLASFANTGKARKMIAVVEIPLP